MRAGLGGAGGGGGRHLLALAHRAHRRLALLARRAVEDEDAVEVVELVLDDARLEAGGLDDEVLAELVAGADADGDRALDVDEHERQAQAALLGDLLVAAGPVDL